MNEFFRESEFSRGRMVHAFALEDECESDMLAISAGALRSYVSRSPCVSILALLECMADSHIAGNPRKER